MTPKVILHPIDSLAAVDKALTQALSLVRAYGAELHVVHVQRGAPRAVADARTMDCLAAIVRDAVEPLVADAPAVVAAVLHGKPVKVVSAYARERSADLIVLDLQRPFGRYWSTDGSAGAIGRAAQCAVLAVPPADPMRRVSHAGGFRRILSAVDFSDASTRALSQALTLARRTAGHITVLHVLEGPRYESAYSGAEARRVITEHGVRVDRFNRALNQLVPDHARLQCDVEVETVSGLPHDAILRTARRRQCDLIVLGLPPQTLLERFVTGSTLSRVVRRATWPVLVVPGPLGPA